MLLFSLGELDDIFGHVDLELIKQVRSGIKKIRKNYRKKQGFIKSLILTDKRILKAFFVYNIFSQLDTCKDDIITNWNAFVEGICANDQMWTLEFLN